jgi:hypothetical protein
MAMPYFSRINSASISARWITGRCSLRASATSGIRGIDRRTRHHHVGAVDVFRAVSLEDERAEIVQARGDRRRAKVASGDTVAQGEQHLGDTAHADAADTDEMNAL